MGFTSYPLLEESRLGFWLIATPGHLYVKKGHTRLSCDDQGRGGVSRNSPAKGALEPL
jgi:hypothetical protein